jgi:hypothetical protein
MTSPAPGGVILSRAPQTRSDSNGFSVPRLMWTARVATRIHVSKTASSISSSRCARSTARMRAYTSSQTPPTTAVRKRRLADDVAQGTETGDIALPHIRLRTIRGLSIHGPRCKVAPSRQEPCNVCQPARGFVPTADWRSKSYMTSSQPASSTQPSGKRSMRSVGRKRRTG